MQKNKSLIVHNRMVGLVAIFILLGIFFLLYRDIVWIQTSTYLLYTEFIAVMIAAFVAITAFTRFFSQKNNKFLFIGAGFFGVALLDFFHFLALSYGIENSFFDSTIIVPWSWLVSRMFLASLLFFSWIMSRREDLLGDKGKVSKNTVYGWVIITFFIIFISFIFISLPQIYFPHFIFSRPFEFIPGILFLVTFIGYLRGNKEFSDEFDYWLLISLIISVCGQMIFMSQSFFLFDVMFHIAHILKLLSYISILLGLLSSIFQVFKTSESLKINLQKSNQELEKINAVKDEFISVASHELRTPITIIQGYIELFQNGTFGKTTQKQQQYFMRIQENNTSMLEIINNMLDISKLELGLMPIHKEYFLIQEFLNDLVLDFQHIFIKKNITFISQISYKNEQKVYTDKNLLKHVLHNLLSNAYKFTPDGGEVKLQSSLKQKNIIISIIDSGIGINSKDQKKIFSKFSQIDGSHQRQYKGMGLGLNIVKRIIHKLDGDISLVSNPHIGSEFTIRIPLEKKSS